MNVREQITAASIGGNAATWGYNSYGQLTSSAASGVQGYTYTPNTTTGNLTSRSNSLKSLTENFYYDTSDRLDYVTQGGTTTLDLGYDTKGNITTKSDAGTLVYDLSGKPYAVGHVNPYSSNFPSASQLVYYTSFGKVSAITEGVYSASFKYNANNERIKMVINQSGTVIKTKYYFAGSYEKVVEGATTTEYIWIGGDPYTAVAVAKISGGVTTVYSIFRDNLGSITHIKTGNSPADEYSFDAFGRRRSADDWSYTLDANDKALFADRGFTGHEYLGQFGLYNMNGRLYDPLVGRFLSPDNYVQSPDFTQSFNRYSYCLNNPLRYTDPSGDNPELIGIGIYAAFVYLKGAHDNRNMETGKWAWNPASWFGKGKTGFVAGISTNTDFTSMNYYAGLYSPDFSPVLSYNPNYGLGMGNVTNPGSGVFYYPSYNPPSEEQKANEFIYNANIAANSGGGLGWEPFVGTAGSIASELYYSEKYGTWMGKNFKLYKQTWGGNGFTGGKNKFGKTTSNAIKWGGRALGAWNAYSIQRDYAVGEMGTGWMMAEQGTNVVSTFGGIYGAAWGVGWELGRAVTNIGWYQEAKFNFWYNRWESQVGPPSQSNETLWNYFYQNYEP